MNNKKSILLIAPVFFGYYKDIMCELENMGYDVKYICDAPSNSNISKAIGRINKKFIRRSTEKYFIEKCEPIIDKYKFDYVLLVGGMTFSFTPEMIQKIRQSNPNAKFVMYQWDSEKNLPYSVKIHKYFDEIYSFDLNDCKEKSFYKFLPLFYTRKYEEIGMSEVNSFKYDCSYIGTAHPKKYKDINDMANALKEVFPKQYIYHYMPSKLKFIYHKVFAEEFKKAKYKEFGTEKVEIKELMEIISSSKCILDAPQAGQTGLTIRTIECLGAKRKLITTNADVVNYDFYNPRNILVFDGNVDKNAPFFTQAYDPIDSQLYQQYSLRNWIRKMIEN